MSSDDSMNTGAVGVPSGSPSPAAERMRTFRRRRKHKYRVIRIEICPLEIDELVKRGYLDQKDRDDRRTIERAANLFFSDMLFTS
jgi:hypothetical protein